LPIARKRRLSFGWEIPKPSSAPTNRIQSLSSIQHSLPSGD